MEAKLKEYRALRKRKESLEKTKEKLERTKDKILDLITFKIFQGMKEQKKEDEVLLLEDDHIDDIEEETFEAEVPEVEEIPVSWRYFIIKWSIITIVWILLYAFFLKVQFGAVFFGISLLIGICLNTRTRPRKRGEVSAYSVFNRNCESIEGTTKAEDLQKQMLYGGRIF